MIEKSLKAVAVGGMVGCVMTVVSLLTPPPKQETLIPLTGVVFPPFEEMIKDKIAWCNNRMDCKILSEAGYHESRNQSEIGVVSVMHVILTRVRDKRWPDTIRGVVYQPHQFSYVRDGSKARGMTSYTQSLRMKVLAYDVLHGLIASPVGEANHYHATYVNPSWAKRMEYVMNVDDHIFFKG